MSPMSLLNLPTSALREGSMTPQHASPHGERAERRLGLWATVVTLALVVALCIAT